LRRPDAAAVRAPAGREFTFCEVTKFVMGTSHSARDLSEFAAAIAEIEASSLYYHLFDTRYDGAQRPNDFATWAENSLGNKALAPRLSTFDPYMFSLEQARRVILRHVAEVS